MNKLNKLLRLISYNEVSLLDVSLLAAPLIVFIFWRIIKDIMILSIIKKDKNIKNFKISRNGIEVNKEPSRKKKKERKKEKKSED
ncbi:hypothetical protein Q4Q35_00290 [Flavivirga aquimarina]|uniref:Uncharacterized protein n=1 Tax=Flavivirga aquimarina TaxID=2027862 RepID=A0ABT8W544_9FLAO|nr:hypothetical protein [Flavivirga aquimarina]MDO5968234.1 hypothetical protein [Flavivirga aquimarina]